MFRFVLSILGFSLSLSSLPSSNYSILSGNFPLFMVILILVAIFFDCFEQRVQGAEIEAPCTAESSLVGQS